MAVAETCCHGKPPTPAAHRLCRISIACPFATPCGWSNALGRGTPRAHGLSDPLRSRLKEVRSRLGYLDEVGLGYLTLDRPTRSLSGGETERVNLTTCLGTRLVNTLFVLDEPSVGLAPARHRPAGRASLSNFATPGNTVVVVEHEASVMRAADQIVDLGPGHGDHGGAGRVPRNLPTQILRMRQRR